MDNLKNLDILTDEHLKTLMNIYTEKQTQYYSLHNKNLELYEENIYKIYIEQIKRKIHKMKKLS